jgi:uncharacterized protein (DUF885 family)
MTSRALAVLLFLSGCGGDDAPASRQPLPSVEEVRAELAGLPFDDFLERSFERLLQRSPTSVVELGLEGEIDVGREFIDDVSDAFTRETQHLEAQVLELARGFARESLPADDRVALDAYLWWLDSRVRGHRFSDLAYRVVPTVTSIPLNTQLFFTDVHPVTTADEAERYVLRLGAVGPQMREVRAELERLEEDGVLTPRLLLEWSRDGLRDVGESFVRDTAYYRTLETKLAAVAIDPAARADLLARAEEVISGSLQPGYRALEQIVAQQIPRAPLAVGVWQHPDGDAYYAHALRHHVTAEVTADELHELGLAELQRIHAELDLRFATLGYPAGAPLADQIARVASDAGFVPSNEVVAGYTSIIADAQGRLEAAFDLVPSAGVIVTGVPSGGFYVGPSLDNRRPGAFFATVAPGGEARFGMRTLSYHEAVPGHHLQIGVAQDLPLPLFQRVVGFTGYVEGWALYAEWLAGDLGWYAGDVHGDVGRLQAEAFRAARLVVDTGIHARRWTFAQAVDFFRQNTGFGQRFSEGQIARYAAWPGQATSYWMGRTRILELRRAWQAAQGAAFDVKAFHRAVLSHGSLPLEVLATVAAPPG